MPASGIDQVLCCQLAAGPVITLYRCRTAVKISFKRDHRQIRLPQVLNSNRTAQQNDAGDPVSIANLQEFLLPGFDTAGIA